MRGARSDRGVFNIFGVRRIIVLDAVLARLEKGRVTRSRRVSADVPLACCLGSRWIDVAYLYPINQRSNA